jgi:acetolactate synthase-1/2/3 large subunit
MPSVPHAPARSRLAGHALVEALIAQGIDTAFGVPGESYLAVLDGFHEHRDSIRFIACRHESGAAFMADAAARLTGRPGVCLVTRGPGATNASIGLHTAFQDSVPLVLLVGQVSSGMRDREAFQELDLRAVFGPNSGGLAKWVGEVQHADRIPEYVARAFHIAMQGRPGPVVLSLPEDMLAQHTAAPVLPRAQAVEAWPSPGALRELRRLLASSERPLVIAGGRGWSDDAVRALQRFAENWRLPVACAFRCQDLFDNAHPLYAGHVGIGIDPRLAERIRAADLVIAVGARLGEMTTGGYTLLEAPRPAQKLVHVHAGAEELGRVYEADLMLQASMSCASKALETLAAPADVPWAAWAASAHADCESNLEPPPAAAPLDMAAVVRTMQRLAPPDAIVTNGAGNYSGWLHRYWRHRAPRTQLAPTAGSMGYGVPAGVAAGIVLPGRTVITLAGDGDFLMTGQELATAMAYGARPIVVVVDNASYGTIRMHQEREYPGRVSGSDLRNPDFALLARAYGLAASTVERTDEFEPAFAAALACERPTLIHLKLDVETITTRTTLSAMREAALRRAAPAHDPLIPGNTDP